MAEPQFDKQYQDRTDLAETFSDHLEKFLFDGHTFRAEFCVKRYDKPKAQGKKGTETRVPVARLVLSRAAMIDLYNKLLRTMNALEKKGVVKKRGAGQAPKAPTKVQ